MRIQIYYNRNFKRAFNKQTKSVQYKFYERLSILVKDQFHYSLNNLALSGKFLGLRSFDVTGNIRVHYKEDRGVIILINIGSHAQLY